VNLYQSALFKKGTNIMLSNEESSSLHEQAASEHEEAAKHHHKAAECHSQNKVSDAKGSSKSAMECCNKAQTHSATACENSAE
jgi:hypothetical protein